jgi:lipoprotein-anchoring transpeptidase ErfK/SrfK
MNSLKTMAMVAVLAVIAYAAFVAINNSGADQAPPPEVAEDWPTGAPQISLGESDGTGFSMGGPNDFPPPGVPPMPGGSSELSPPLAFSERAPAPPFTPAPMPPEISSDLNAAPPSAASDPPYAPTPPRGDSTGGIAGSGPSSNVPPLPNLDAGAAPPLPPEGLNPGMVVSPKKGPKSTEIRPEFTEFLTEAKGYLSQGRFRESLGILSSRYGEPDQTDAEAKALTELLDQVAGTVIYSTQHHMEPAYVVQAGESLSQIADKYEVPQELLMKINGIPDPNKLQSGQELKVVRGPFRAVVKLEEHELVLWLQDLYAGRFPIGVGSDEPQMEGSFVVRDKNREPTYYDRTGRRFDPGDPLNPLGKRRIGLGGSVALHGTNDEDSIGTTGGPGAVRLGDRDAEDVFDILSLNSQIIIRR